MLGVIAALVWGEDSDTAVVMAGAGVVLAVLGYLDDVRGDRRAGGFAGHVRELVHGRITTGLVKAVGGGVVGLLAAWGVERRGVWIDRGRCGRRVEREPYEPARPPAGTRTEGVAAVRRRAAHRGTFPATTC